MRIAFEKMDFFANWQGFDDYNVLLLRCFLALKELDNRRDNLRFVTLLTTSQMDNVNKENMRRDYLKTFYPEIDFEEAKVQEEVRQVDALEKAIREFSELRFAPSNNPYDMPASFRKEFAKAGLI